MKYSLRILLIAITVIALLVGWIMSTRAKGPDKFLTSLKRIGGTNDNGVPSYQPGNVAANTTVPKPVSLVAKVLGNTADLKKHILLSDCKLTQASANQFARLADASKFEQVEIRNVQVDEGAVCFFESWSNVKAVSYTHLTLPTKRIV